MRRKFFSYTMVILLAFSLSPLLQLRAAEEEEGITHQMTGKITAWSKQSITIVDETAELDTADALPHSFIIDDKTVIKGEVSEGKTVTITYSIKAAYRAYIQRLALTIELK